MMGPRQQDTRGMSLAETTLAIVVLTTILFAALRLYVDVSQKKTPVMRAQEAETLLLSRHERERPKIFSYPLGPAPVEWQDIEGRTYEIRMRVDQVEGYEPENLRSVEYEIEYKVQDRPQIRRRTVRVDRHHG